MNFKNWFKCTFKGKCVLRTLRDSDDPAYRYILDEELIDKSEVPSEARHCRGEPHYWSLVLIDDPPDGYDPEGYTARAARAVLHTDALDNPLAGLWKEGDHVKLAKILAIAGGAIAVVVIAYVLFRGAA